MDEINLSKNWEKVNLHDSLGLDPQQISEFVNSEFDRVYKPSLMDFIRIKNVSPSFDPNWNTNGFLKNAADHLKNFAENAEINKLKTTILKDDDKTPLLYITIDSSSTTDKKSILMYGHLDKQPPYIGWDKNKDPYIPVEENGRLYGRGSCDDGYALYAALLSIRVLQKFSIPHPAIKIIIEGGEESGSTDLPTYLEKLKPSIGTPELIVCMDSGIGDYKRFWLSNTLRGICNFDLTVQTLTKGIHSGKGTGIAPDSFMILRALLAKLEDSSNGVLKQFETEIPEEFKKAADTTGKIIGMPQEAFLPGVQYMKEDVGELLLNNFWKPCLAIVGANGLPPVPVAGNVLRPFTTVRVSIRLPPNYDSNKCIEVIQNNLLKNVPFNANVKLENFIHANGTICPRPSDKLKESLSKVSKQFYENDYAEIGVGGSIPFINILVQLFPNSLFVIGGCVNNDSNIHGPNENLNLDYCKNFISSLAYLISDYTNFMP